MLNLCIFIGVLGIVTTSLAADIYHNFYPSDADIKQRAASVTVSMAEGKYTPSEEMPASFWINQAQNDLNDRLAKVKKLNINKAKNIIFFLGDGMSIATLTAARILKGQRAGRTGEESKLVIEEEFPYAGLSKTYCTNGQTPDSACTATAYLCGVKTNMLLIGVSARVNYNNCSASADTENHVESLATWAQRAGKSTGLVTTTTVTHASPSANYAHVANRLWECDADIIKYGADPTGGCVDIATQLIQHEPGRNFDVILGGGMSKFIPKTQLDAFGATGQRLDGVNLISEWVESNPKGKFITTRDQLMKLNFTQTKRLFGTFNSGDLEFNLDSAKKRPTQPRLKEMTAAAINTLSSNRDGYFLFVEGGRIDHGHHYTVAGYALDETLEFYEAIRTALDMVSEKDTLVVVSSDHSHTMTIAGYPGRGNPILRLNKNDVDIDGMPYNTLNYAVGREQFLDAQGKRLNLTGQQEDLSFTPSYIKASMGTHAGEDVGVFARGPYAHLFSGTMQQNAIPHMMAYAACIGNGAKKCVLGSG